ncbi:MAG TPA: YitT family protein [Chitinophagaceae bacterium]|nr:YitT family protein [Chitinophagaceae bacterium]
MLTGVGLAVFALKGFMIPNGFLDGGVTGISILLHELNHYSFSALVISINLLFFIPAYRLVGKLFAIRSLIAVALLAAGVQFLHIDAVTSDKLLIAIFGGCFIGLGMGLVIRSGAALDGFEILALFTTKRVGFSMSEVVLFFNSIIFITAATKFGVASAMYSIITYYAALKMADYVVDGIEEYIALTIISRDADLIKSLLVNRFGKGITVYKGERGYLPGTFEVKTDCDVVVTIVTRLELLNIHQEISKIDPKAFMYTHKIKETKGGIVKQRAGH